MSATTGKATADSKPPAKTSSTTRLKPMDSETWHRTMKDFLDDLDHKGAFCVGKRIDLPPFHPKLTLDGINDENGGRERLSFPLPASLAHRIISIAEKAPFGKGMETVLDEKVRKAWQVDASKVHFSEFDVWNQSLKSIVRDVCDTLGLPNNCQVQANLYKMLLYEKGGHFQRHCDTEKEPGMFGTLVIQLPAKHSGGAFVIQHGNETRTMDFAAQSEDACFATAFYADCEHEILPVTSGWRLCLVYNLVMVQQTKREASDGLPSAHALTAQSRQLRTLVNQWPSGTTASEIVKGYLLEHKYTSTNLSFANLKGRDKQLCDLLRNACDFDGKPLFIVCLLLLQKKVQGSAVETDSHYYRRRKGFLFDDGESDSDGSHTMGDVIEEETSVYSWIGPDDRDLDYCEFEFDLESSLLLGKGDKMDEVFGESPDSEEYESYQGNYGPTLEYWYYRSAVVLWPASKYVEVANAFGLDFMASYLLSVPESDALQVAAKAVELLEKEPRDVDTEHLLEGLLRAGDMPLMVRALHKTSSIYNAKTLTNVVRKMDCSAVTAAVCKIMHKSSANGKLSHPCQFITELEVMGKSKAASSARESLVHGFLSGAKKNLELSSQQSLNLMAVAAYRCPVLFPSFVEATIAHATPSQVCSIIDGFATLQGAADNHHVQKLYKSHLAHLKKATRSGAAGFAWRQSKACFVGSQADEVNAFLHGDDQSRTFHGFDGYRHAQNWSNKYFGYASEGRGYNATAVPGENGIDAYVTVTKTQPNEQEGSKHYKAHVAEMNRLMAAFGEARTPSKRANTDSQVGASQKRARGGEEKKSEVIDLTDD